VHWKDICEVCVHTDCFVLKCSVLECYVFLFSIRTNSFTLTFFPALCATSQEHWVRFRRNSSSASVRTLLGRHYNIFFAKTLPHAHRRGFEEQYALTIYTHCRCLFQMCVCVACCSVLQHVAVCVVQIFAPRSSTHGNTLPHTATHCNTLQHTATHCNTLPHTATHCNTLQHTATHCNTLQHTATHCNTLQHSKHTAQRSNTLHRFFFAKSLPSHIVGISRSNLFSMYTHTSHMYVPDVCV